MEKQKSFTLIEHERSKSMRRNESFTLIELLVVIAIIGVLATIVLVNVRSAQVKARDSSIKEDLYQLRNAAEMIFAHNESYETVCDETDDTLSNSGEIGRIEKAIQKNNGGQDVTCFESINKQSFAVSSPLVASVGKHWCVEAAGLSIELDHPIISAKCE